MGQFSLNSTVKLNKQNCHGWSHIKSDNSLVNRQFWGNVSGFALDNYTPGLSTYSAIIHNIVVRHLHSNLCKDVD